MWSQCLSTSPATSTEVSHNNLALINNQGLQRCRLQIRLVEILSCDQADLEFGGEAGLTAADQH